MKNIQLEEMTPVPKPKSSMLHIAVCSIVLEGERKNTQSKTRGNIIHST